VREVEGAGYNLPVGTVEDARALIGTQTPARFSEVDVGWARVKQFCAMTHDANPSYWDPEYARSEWNGIVAPPSMLLAWFTPLEWTPGGGTPEPMLMARVPLPGDTIVNASNDTEFLAPVHVGDRLNVVEELVEVSDERRTALGLGHFVTTLATVRRADGEVVAKSTNVLFRFSAREPS
jgi:acyl dehydratase